MRTEYMLSEEQKREMAKLNNIITERELKYYSSAFTDWRYESTQEQIAHDHIIIDCRKRIADIIAKSNIRVVTETDKDVDLVKKMFMSNN